MMESGKSKKQFPELLYEILELAEAKGSDYSRAVSWLPHGYAFKILVQQVFIEDIVPLYFNQTKIRSFYRQLNLWGYKRVLKGVDAGAWYHESFLRGKPKKMNKMIRVKIKGKSRDNAPEDPDFYSMPALPSITKPSRLPPLQSTTKPITTEREPRNHIKPNTEMNSWHEKQPHSMHGETMVFCKPVSSSSPPPPCFITQPEPSSGFNDRIEQRVPATIYLNYQEQGRFMDNVQPPAVYCQPVSSCGIYPGVNADGQRKITRPEVALSHNDDFTSTLPGDLDHEQTDSPCNEDPPDEFAVYIDRVMKKV